MEGRRQEFRNDKSSCWGSRKAGPEAGSWHDIPEPTVLTWLQSLYFDLTSSFMESDTLMCLPTVTRLVAATRQGSVMSKWSTIVIQVGWLVQRSEGHSRVSGRDEGHLSVGHTYTKHSQVWRLLCGTAPLGVWSLLVTENETWLWHPGAHGDEGSAG
jgi:hypothetical protein